MKVLKKILGGNTLFYRGCMLSYVAKDLAENYRRILNFMKIDFIEMPVELCCGMPLLNAGFEKDFEEQIEKFKKKLEEFGITRIVCACPACYYSLRNNLSKDFEIKSIVELLNNLIEEGKLKVANIGKGKKVTYHDPCHLGRHSNIYEEPRKVIKVLGFELIEMKFTREEAMCCGGGGGVKSNFEELSNALAKERIKEAREVGVKTLITACPLCYMNLSENSEDIEVLELSELLIRGLGK